MLCFVNDYSQGAHEQILKRLSDINREPQTAYGRDQYCESAKEKIRAACQSPQADIFFLVGGTQTNATVINSLLRPYEGVLSADTGHIAAHEAGAIEHTGHKVLTLPHRQGKIDAEQLKAYLKAFYQDETYDHMVIPGMVYLSHPTEYGTLYTKRELEEIGAVCREYSLRLYLDGARLGYGLVSPGTDVTLPVIAQCCDAFYIGGTKVGALFGEAVVFPKKAPAHFFTHVKQHGALLAKGWLLGLQFDTLFTDRLYWRIGEHAMEAAQELVRVFEEKQYPFFLKSPTNQQFVILENSRMKSLAQKVSFSVWAPQDENHTVVRFVTSWATRPEDIEALRQLL
ncbi:MAG: aminotransferase class V-fold PLP-dependent enzyme [Oscillospiraceae bacterium]|nr:aminotransferase class V-fold PLP-dependent enzyme [Oscillospiraceae bacterium]